VKPLRRHRGESGTVMRGWGRRHVTLALGIASASLAACGGSDGGGASTTSVSIRLGADVDTLDPALHNSAASEQVHMLAYDRLVYQDPTGKFKPSLATSWKAVPNGLRFTLAQGATCADGTKVTAEVAAASLRRLGDKKTKSPYAGTVFGPRGHEISADNAAGTVTIKSTKEFPGMLLGLAMPWASIICPAGLENPDALKTKVHGSGPYGLTKSVSGSSYTFTLRDDYDWGPVDFTAKTAGIPKEIVLRPSENESTVANQLASGQLGIGNVRGQDVTRLEGNRNLFRLRSTGSGSTMLLLNQDDASHPTIEKPVRQAIAMAISRESYMQAEAFGQGKAACSFMAPTVPGYAPKACDLVQPHGIEDAKQTLLDAGWAPGADGVLEKDGEPLEVTFITNTAQNSGPDYVVGELEKAGIKPKVVGGTEGSWIDNALKGDFDIAVLEFTPPIGTFQWGADALAVIGHLGKQNPEYGKAASAARLASTQAEANRLWQEAQIALIGNVGVGPLYDNVYYHYGNGWEFKVVSGSGRIVDPYTIRAVNR
jgi:peptide/nickel transport system substrate-binding protein